MTPEMSATCRHCGKPIRKGEPLVNWPWIHDHGFYQCTLAEGSLKAEPCYACNGWDPVSGVRRRETVGMVCPVCGHDYASVGDGHPGVRLTEEA